MNFDLTLDVILVHIFLVFSLVFCFPSLHLHGMGIVEMPLLKNTSDAVLFIVLLQS